MKEIEKALLEDYKETLNPISFKNKGKLYSLYDEAPRHSPTIHRMVFRRAAACAACAAVLAAGTTAVALTNPDRFADIRTFLTDRLRTKGVSDDKIDEYTKFSLTVGTSTDDIAQTLETSEVNSYGEVISNDLAVFPTYCDLCSVRSKEAENPVTGYIYRYDLGVLNKFSLTEEEQSFLYSSTDPMYMYLKAPNSEGFVRDWVYVYDRDGTEILGKYAYKVGFYTNEELEDPEIASKYQETPHDHYYEELCTKRTEQKLATGKAFETPKIEIKLPDLPEEGFTHFISLRTLEGVLFSEDATAVSSDPSVFEIDEIIVMNYANHSWINGYFHKAGTSTITITDGDQEYVLDVSVTITPRGYHIEDKRIK